jgi:UDP-glucuronate 4-epimerase
MPPTEHFNRSVLITGAGGFIGFHLAQSLLKAGYIVVGIDNLNNYYDENLKRRRIAILLNYPSFIFSHLDITDYNSVKSLFALHRPEFVVHLAAQAGVRYSISNPRSYVHSNVDGFLSILESAREHPIRHLIYASSSSVYGANVKIPFHEDDPVLEPNSFYAATKRANELMAQSYAHLFAIPCSGLRFFTVYGPWGRPDMAYFSFTKAIIEGCPISVYNHGKMQRDFTYVDDVTEAIMRLLHVPPTVALAIGTKGLDTKSYAPHRLYNIGNHTPVELASFIATIESAVGRTAVKEFLEMQAGDVPTTFADTERLKAVTDFAPKTALAEGIGRFVAWYRAYYSV